MASDEVTPGGGFKECWVGEVGVGSCCKAGFRMAHCDGSPFTGSGGV